MAEPAAVRLVTQRRAQRDLDEIWRYIARFDPAAATRQIDRIKAASLRLVSYPESAPAQPEIGKDARGLVCDRYVVLYRVSKNTVQIVRVMHQARELTGILDRA